ncbi:uncharacterized protein LOC142242494 isoform X2 [Haematobia irritans]
MVNEALVELHSSKGISLQKLFTHIAGKYVITLSNVRKALIKKQLNVLKDTKDIVSLSGKGIGGRLKLANIKEFRLKFSQSSKSKKSKSNKSEKENIEDTETRFEDNTTMSTKLGDFSAITIKPMKKRSSVFDTPPLGSMQDKSPMGYDTYNATPTRHSLPFKKKKLADVF